VTRRLGLLTSGGDCAGLNAVIRGVVQHAALTHDIKVIGIRNGHHGLLTDPPDIIDLEPSLFKGNLLRTGGTFLGTSTSAAPGHLSLEEEAAALKKGLSSADLDALIVIGGDGSMRIMDRLIGDALPWVGVPKTIDNDVRGTDFAVGFFTAVQVVTDSFDRLHTTAASHRRIMVLETMGRQSGFIALYGGLAGGVDAILLPEADHDLEALCDHITLVRKQKHDHILISIAEGVKSPAIDSPPLGTGATLAHELSQRTGIDARCTVLGHVQRGGSPTSFDRLLASSLSTKAVDILIAGGKRRLAAWNGGVLTDVPMDEVVAGPRLVAPDNQLVRTARNLDVFLGGFR
jgi:6-phosphofructokinase